MIRMKNESEHDLVLPEGVIPAGGTVDFEDEERAKRLIERNPYLKRVDDEKVIVISSSEKKEETAELKKGAHYKKAARGESNAE